MSAGSIEFGFDQATAVATITLNRPGALNAIDIPMAEELSAATARAAHDRTIRAVLIRGAGKHFMAGGDIKAFYDTLDDPPEQRRRLFERLIGLVHESVIRIRTMEKPVVGAVRGATAGFGLSLAMGCDLVVAEENAYFTMGYCLLGTSPDGGSTYALPRLVGLKQAMEIAMLGDRFGAGDALRLGLVNRVLGADSFEAESLAFAARLAAGPTIALGRTKRLLNDSLNRTLAEQLLAEQESFAGCALTEDFKRGVRAFVGKHPADFKGE